MGEYDLRVVLICQDAIKRVFVYHIHRSLLTNGISASPYLRIGSLPGNKNQQD
jgi:hypothetical protein